MSFARAAIITLIALNHSLVRCQLPGAIKTTLRVAIDDSASGRPIIGAHVQLIGSTSAVSDSLGRVTFVNVPLGIAAVVVRAIGYQPESTVIHVVATGSDSTATLIDIKPITKTLETIQVKAPLNSRLSSTGFELRRQTGFGHFLDSAVFQSSPHQSTASIIAGRVRGLRFSRDPFGTEQLLSSTMTTRVRDGTTSCVLDVYVNGLHQSSAFNMAEVSSGDILGVEVYSATTAPPQFKTPSNSHSSGNPGCGVVVIWLR